MSNALPASNPLSGVLFLDTGRAVPNMITGQWGEPVEWRRHILNHHLHQVLMVS